MYLSSCYDKVIDFDTTKLCLSNFVKGRIMAAFFKRTAKEFRDNELAGTLPYMAPESFKEVESKIVRLINVLKVSFLW